MLETLRPWHLTLGTCFSLCVLGIVLVSPRQDTTKHESKQTCRHVMCSISSRLFICRCTCLWHRAMFVCSLKDAHVCIAMLAALLVGVLQTKSVPMPIVKHMPCHYRLTRHGIRCALAWVLWCSWVHGANAIPRSRYPWLSEWTAAAWCT
jgi:hypothetical protein